MQKLPKLTKLAGLGAISLCCLLLRTTARAWQDETPSDSSPVEDLGLDESAPVASPEATQLLTNARDRLSQHRSVQAEMIERAEFGDRRLIAHGKFFAGEFPRTRLEYEVQIGDTQGSLLEICDGQILHIQRTIGPIETAEKDPAATEKEKTATEDAEASPSEKPAVDYVRRDVQQILRAATAGQNVSLPMHAADLGLGGVSAVLASLERCMVFESVRTEEHEGRAYKVLEGRWNPAYRSDLLGKLGGAARQVAPFLPDRIRVDLESESLFPVRILYLKLASLERKFYRPMVSLEFRNVQFDVDLPADAFEYKKPEGVEPVDDTRDFVQLLNGPPAAPPAAPAEGAAPSGTP
jgi:hypothetical protein